MDAGAPLLTYVSGNEFDPGDPTGEDRLAVHPDGRLDFSNRFRGTATTRSGRLAGGVVEDLVDRLSASGFPRVPAHPVPGGSALRVLSAGGGSAVLAWHAGGRLPGYAELFALLDGIVTAARTGDESGPVAGLGPPTTSASRPS